MSTGRRSDIFGQIEALRDVGNNPELASALIPILNQFAYHYVTDGGVMEAQEEWHSGYNEALRKAARSDAAKATKAAKEAAHAHRASKDAAVAAATLRQRAVKKLDARAADSSGLSASLNAILNGTHKSLHGQGDYDNDDD